MKQWEIRQAAVGDAFLTAAPSAATSAAPSPAPSPADVPHVLVEQLPIIVWTTDSVLMFTSSNGSELGELTLGPNQIVGLTLFDLFDTDDPRSPVVAAHLQALGGRTVSFETRLADRDFHGRVAPLRDGEGEQIGTVCAVVEDDIGGPVVLEASSALVTLE